MNNIKLEGATDGVGADQGFMPISVLYGSVVLQARKGDTECHTVTTAWEPTSDEINRLIEGEKFVITLLTDRWPACKIAVQPIEGE